MGPAGLELRAGIAVTRQRRRTVRGATRRILASRWRATETSTVPDGQPDEDVESHQEQAGEEDHPADQRPFKRRSGSGGLGSASRMKTVARPNIT